MPANYVNLTFRGGELRVHGWPTELPVPFGLRAEREEMRGPARLRSRVLDTLRAAGRGVRDDASPPMAARIPAASGPPSSLLSTLQRHHYRGLIVGLAEADRTALVAAAIRALGQPALIVVADSGAEHVWQRACHDLAIREHATICTVAYGAREVHWLGGRYELLVVDSPELMPHGALQQTLDGAVARARIGFPDRLDSRTAERWSAGIGPTVAVIETTSAPRCQQLRVPMPDEIADRYREAWHAFLRAFDRFAALQPNVGFGTFVQQARGIPQQRPGLLAWHEALRLAAWHPHKATVVAELLAQHMGQRILVFTPDRRVAYELSQEHLIAPITAELPRAERRETIAAFLAGELRVLTGPRLLDLGVPEHSADVGILVGGGFGQDQRTARCRRIVGHGVVYEIVSQDTVEIGRAHRWRRHSGVASSATAVEERRF